MIMVPVLTMLFGFTVHEAIGTSLAIDAITATIVAYTFYQKKNGNINSNLYLILSSDWLSAWNTNCRIYSRHWAWKYI